MPFDPSLKLSDFRAGSPLLASVPPIEEVPSSKLSSDCHRLSSLGDEGVLGVEGKLCEGQLCEGQFCEVKLCEGLGLGWGLIVGISNIVFAFAETFDSSFVNFLLNRALLVVGLACVCILSGYSFEPIDGVLVILLTVDEF